MQFEIKNLFNKKNEFHFSGCSRTIQGAIKHFDLTAAAHSYNELLFIDDNSFIKVQTINFLYRINNKSIIGRIKSIVYTDSLDGGYLAEIISANVKGVIHKMETQLLDTSRYTEPKSKLNVKDSKSINESLLFKMKLNFILHRNNKQAHNKRKRGYVVPRR